MANDDWKWALAGLIGLVIGGGVVWAFTRPTIDELRKKVKLLEDRVYEFQTRYETDLNTIKAEHSILYGQIQELRKTALTSETKQKVEELFQILEQAYQSKQAEKQRPTYAYA
jgi:hypothetical protein